MNGSRPSSDESTATERAMVPFAVIGALVLLTSVTLVGSVHVQSDPEIAADVTTAMERTEVATQSALEKAVIQATVEAGKQPLTATANSSAGQQLAHSAESDQELFETYLKALIATSADSALKSSGQQVGDVETTVKTPAIDDVDSFGEAIERVTLTEPTDGQLTVELSEIELRAELEGEPVETKTKSMSITVSTPLFELHERTERFEEQLDSGLTSSGFGQRFTAQLYALGWARGYAQYGGAPITEVIANRHLEPMTNQALYQTQQDVFGEADPHLDNALRQGWFCMATQDAEGLYEGYRNTETDVSSDICSKTEWVFGDSQTGTLPDAPDTLDLLGEAPRMDATHTVGVNETAYLPFRTLVSGDDTHSVDAILERVFTVEPRVESTIEADVISFNHSKPNNSASVVQAERNHVQTTINQDSIEISTRYTDEIADHSTVTEVTGSLTVEEEKTWRWTDANETTHRANTTDSVTRDIELSVEIGAETIAPDSLLPKTAPIEKLSDSETIDDETNSRISVFTDAESLGEALLVEMAGGSTQGDVASWLETELESSTTTASLSLIINETVMLDDQVSPEFQSKLLTEIRTLQTNIAGVSHSFERSEILHRGTTETAGPIAGLRKAVEKERQQLVGDEHSDGSLSQLAQAELKQSYFMLLQDDLKSIDDGHSAAVGQLDEVLADVDDGLDHGLTALQKGMNPERPEPVPIETTDRTANLTYEIHGSPTYLTTETVTGDAVPQLDTADEFAPLSLKNRNHLQLPYQRVTDGLLDTVFSAIGFGEPDAELSLQMAGEALRAGELATEAAEQSEYGSADLLHDGTNEIRSETDSAIDEFVTEFSNTLAVTLYPTEIQLTQHTGEPLDEASSAVPDTCRATEVNCVIPAGTTADQAQDVIESALTATLEEYDTVGEQAIAIGEGKITEEVTQKLLDDLGTEGFRPNHLNQQIAWEGKVESSVYPTLITSAEDQRVTVSDVEAIEELDEQIREALSDVSSDVIEDRLSSTLEDRFDIESYDSWVDGVDTPVRVPAGMPLLPVPGMWYATVNAWEINTHGEYGRFEVSTDLAATDSTTSMSYVRENSPVKVRIDGEKRKLGTVEPISFQQQTTLLVVVPPGGIGVGDRTTDNPECSELYPVTGPVDDETHQCES